MIYHLFSWFSSYDGDMMSLVTGWCLILYLSRLRHGEIINIDAAQGGELC